MKKLVLFVIAVFTLISCNSNKYIPSDLLTPNQESDVKLELSRLMEKLPYQTKMEDRWDTASYRVEYYKMKADSMKLVCFHEGRDGYKYFLITRVVPSLTAGDRRGSVGRFHWDAKAKRISDLEEYLLTNIMQPAKIEEAAVALFEAPLEKDTLPENFEYKEMVEWPNEYFAYDKKNHNWDRRVYFQPAK